MLPVYLFAFSLALLVYGLASRLPFPQDPLEPARPSLLYPLEARLRRDLEKARLKLAPRLLLNAMLISAALGVLLVWPLQNKLLGAISASVFGLIPYQLVRGAIRQRARVVQAAVEPALVQIARLCEVRRHPLPALYDAVPMLQQPLKAELETALYQAREGTELADALRLMASRCCDNFYLHQLAELVAITTRHGGDLPAALLQLAARLRTAEELKAEQAAELFGYKWLTRILLAAALLPLPYWALTGAPAWQVYLKQPVAQAILVWVVVSGLGIVLLPYWMAIED